MRMSRRSQPNAYALGKSAGKQLAKLRKRRGLTLRDVYEISQQVATMRRNASFVVPYSRLSEIENKRGNSKHSPLVYTVDYLQVLDEKVDGILWTELKEP
jgi:hypothetical protein